MPSSLADRQLPESAMPDTVANPSCSIDLAHSHKKSHDSYADMWESAESISSFLVYIRFGFSFSLFMSLSVYEFSPYLDISFLRLQFQFTPS